MIDAQSCVTSMCESVDVMKITPKQKDFVKAAFRAAIEYANAKHATKEAKAAAAVPSDQRGPQ